MIHDSEYASCCGPTLLEQIPEYKKIIDDLSKGNLNLDNFNLNNRKSKLSRSLNEILFDVNNDELSYFILFMDDNNASYLVKFLLDLNNFESTVKNRMSNGKGQDLPTQKTNCKTYRSTTDEALTIFQKYISKDAKFAIDIPDSLISETITRICPENGEPIQQTCFHPVKQYVIDQIQNLYFYKYLSSDYHCKYILHILDNQNLTLYDVLYDDLAVVYFLEFLEQENVSDLLKFFVQAEMFSRTLESRIAAKHDLLKSSRENLDQIYRQLQDDAMLIYDNFISLQAKRALGFDSLIRRQVELNISIDLDRDENSFDYLLTTFSNCFYVPMLIVFCVLDKVYFGKFLRKSTMYESFKREILASVRQSRPSVSDARSSVEQQDETKPNLVISSAIQVDLPVSNIPHDDSIWNLGEPCIAELSTDNNNSSYNLNDFKKKFEKFRKSLIALSSQRKTKQSEDDEYEMAEKVAAQLINDVIKANQLNGL